MANLIGGKAKFRATIGDSDRKNGNIELREIEQKEKIVADSGWVEDDQSRMRNLLKGDVIDFTAIVMLYEGKARLTQIRSIERVL